MEEQNHSFKLIAETRFYKNNALRVYQSSKTGLHIIIASVDGPVVNGYFTVVTEASSDDGLPHTLEHLIFLGSEDYSYKGVLDLLANRCLADGTNAWTSIDHTAYTVKTCGSEGFLNLLPIYLDHVLYPTLTDSAFTTEVYHVTGEGEDAGVVYCEMQARENSGESLTYLEVARSIYPGDCGYRYETGGIMANLRESITNKKIKDYHKEMYRPENLYVIMTGPINSSDVFRALQPFEEKIMAKGDRGQFTRPFQKPVPPFEESISKKILYPSDNEDTGKVCFAWRGPCILNQLEECLAFEILLDYLTHSSVSPLPKVLIDVDDPLASEVESYILELSKTAGLLTFDGVPYSKLDLVEGAVMETLHKIANGIIAFDMAAMRDVINNSILEEDDKMESKPHSTLSSYIIQYALYGNDKLYLDHVVNKQASLERLYKQEEHYWLSLIDKYLIRAPSLIINAIPSIKECERLKEEVEKRVSERKEKLGTDGLKKLQKQLEEAQNTNEIPPPDELLRNLPVPSIHSIDYHSIELYSNITNGVEGSLTTCPFIPLEKIQIKVELDHIKSNFLQITAKLDTSSLTSSQKLYLPLLSELLLESPLRRDGKVIQYEDVIKQLDADTLFANTWNGLRSGKTFSYASYFANLCINMKVSIDNCTKGITWIKDILSNVIMDVNRVRVKASKLINSIGENKRDGIKMAHLMYNRVLFAKDANANTGNCLVQERFLKKILKDIESNPGEIINQLNDVYREITSLGNVSLHLASDLQKLSAASDIPQLLQSFTNRSSQASANFHLNVVTDSSQRVGLRMKADVSGYIAGLGSVESAYLTQITNCIDDFSHKDLPAILVAITYLTQLEGPLWKQIRGQGLSYSYGIGVQPSEGTLNLRLYRAAQLTEAYKVTMNILKSYLDGTEKWNLILFESAKSSLMYEIIAREANISNLVLQSILSYYRRVSSDYNRKLVKMISDVTLEEMESAAIKYFTPLIDPKLSVITAVCQTSKEKELQKCLNEFGHNTEIVSSLEGSFFSEA